MLVFEDATPGKATMPYSYDVDPAARMAFVRGWGAIDIDETLRAPVELSQHPDFERDFGVVVDMRVVEYRPRAEELVTMARNLIRLRRLFTHRVAAVVPGKLSLAGELASAIAGAGGFPIRVFEDLEEATAWALAGDRESLEDQREEAE